LIQPAIQYVPALLQLLPFLCAICTRWPANLCWAVHKHTVRHWDHWYQFTKSQGMANSDDIIKSYFLNMMTHI